MPREAGRVCRVESLDDPRLACYRNLKDRQLAAQGRLFIAEGEFIVRRLIASGWGVDSLLASPRLLAELEPLLDPAVPVYVAPDDLLTRIVGFSFHLGVLGCGRRPAWPTLEQAAAGWGPEATVLTLPEITNGENLGALLRVAAGFGVSSVILGPRCCDPLYRLCVRVSMGTVFSLPIVRSSDLEADCLILRDRHGFELAAAVLDGDAIPLRQFQRPARLSLLLGNEAQGLAPQHVALCRHRLTIPMKLGTDSLNVAVAAVFLYHVSTTG